METTLRFRSLLAPWAGLALIIAISSPFSPSPLFAQSGSESAEDAEEASASDVPPIPDWSPTDPSVKGIYEQARVDLEAGRYDEAERGFKKIRSKARGTDGEATVDRCLREADGGQLCEKAAKYVKKEQPRKIIALFAKEEEKVEGTFTGEALRGYYEEAMAEVFHVLADFEKKKSSSDEDSGDDDDEDEGDDPPRGGDARGRTEYGANTRLVKGDPEEGEVRKGKGSLYWTTTNDIGFVTLQVPDDVDLEDYRYLRISFRTEEPKAKPPLMLIFDCESGNFGAGGQGGARGGRGGRRGGAMRQNAIRNRIGFHLTVTPKSRWQDLRLDLRKFEDRGNPRWQNVLNLRIAHLGAGEPSGIFIDDLILEKE